MKYLLAIIFPPAALLLCGKPFQCLLNLIFFFFSIPLTLMFGVGVVIWLLCILHAFTACVGYDREKQERLAHLAEPAPQVMATSMPSPPAAAA